MLRSDAEWTLSLGKTGNAFEACAWVESTGTQSEQEPASPLPAAQPDLDCAQAQALAVLSLFSESLDSFCLCVPSETTHTLW